MIQYESTYIFPPFYIEVEFFNIKRGSYHNQNNITPSELLDTENQPIIGEKHFLEKSIEYYILLINYFSSFSPI